MVRIRIVGMKLFAFEISFNFFFYFLENLHKEYEKKIQQNEQNWSQQMSSNKDTLESLKEQIHRDAEDQIEVLNKKYMLQLGEI